MYTDPTSFASDHANNMHNPEYRRSFKRLALRIKLYDVVMNLRSRLT